MNMPDQNALSKQFRSLHDNGCFVIANPWDAGSARLLAQLGFKALATTSAGFAWSLGKADNHVELSQLLEHLRAITASVNVPVNADFKDGYAVEPTGVFANVTLAVQTAIAGLSIEDSSGIEADPLFEFTLAVERLKAARRAIDDSGSGVLLTGRSEGFIVGRPDLPETIRRLTAYADAGADCLYAPGVRDKADVAAIVKELAPKPVNVLVNSDFFRVQELADIGVRRISVGGALARTAYTAAYNAAQEIIGLGAFNAFGATGPRVDFDGLFA